MLTIDPASLTDERTTVRGLPIQTVNTMSDLVDPLLGDSVDAVILSRETPKPVMDWLTNTQAEMWPRGRFVMSAHDVSACVLNLFATANIPTSPALSWLSEDAERLAHSVCGLAQTPKVRLRLEPVFDNACSKFHIDNVVARLICTYVGPGTELSATAGHAEPLYRVPTGAPILLKGKAWPNANALRLHHRSPPIAGTGIARLVMVLEGCAPEDVYPTYDQLYPEHAS